MFYKMEKLINNKRNLIIISSIIVIICLGIFYFVSNSNNKTEKYFDIFLADLYNENTDDYENKIKFSFNYMQIISKVIDGTFPDYTKVIPQLNDKSITTNNDDLKKAIDRVSAVAINEESKSKAIKLVIESNRLSLSVDSTSRGSAIEEIDLDYNKN